MEICHWCTGLTTFSLAYKGKVFVTYEVDNEDHLKEVIKFVALLRNNGFDTHVREYASAFVVFFCEIIPKWLIISICLQIDVFEQQLYSINKIDCMERYLNEVMPVKGCYSFLLIFF